MSNFACVSPTHSPSSALHPLPARPSSPRLLYPLLTFPRGFLHPLLISPQQCSQPMSSTPASTAPTTLAFTVVVSTSAAPYFPAPGASQSIYICLPQPHPPQHLYGCVGGLKTTYTWRRKFTFEFEACSILYVLSLILRAMSVIIVFVECAADIA